MGKTDLVGASRVREPDRGNALAGSSTLNRLELSTAQAAHGHRYKRIAADPQAMDRLLAEVFLEAYAKPPREIWLDLDATDDPLHGHQEGRFFHGYYGCYCYLPLYIFCGDHLLCARLRPADIDACAARWIAAELSLTLDLASGLVLSCRSGRTFANSEATSCSSRRALWRNWSTRTSS